MKPKLWFFETDNSQLVRQAQTIATLLVPAAILLSNSTNSIRGCRRYCNRASGICGHSNVFDALQRIGDFELDAEDR